jgi:hypothetical protein
VTKDNHFLLKRQFPLEHSKNCCSLNSPIFVFKIHAKERLYAKRRLYCGPKEGHLSLHLEKKINVALVEALLARNSPYLLSTTLGTESSPSRGNVITQVIRLPTHFTLKMEAAYSSKALVFAYRTTKYHNPQDHNLNNYMALNKINITWRVLDNANHSGRLV